MRETLWKLITLFILFTGTDICIAKEKNPAANNDPGNILLYINNSWTSLQRSFTDCSTLSDTKIKFNATLYLPTDFPIPAPVAALKKRCPVSINRLPSRITEFGKMDINKIQPAGLLYLPNPYVVPGGMFNEMYGWDSYFIIRGLIEDGKVNAARDMVENFFFEIKHYGGILNGNRTYYLTRTQLPFLTPMIRSVYEAEQKQKRAKLSWLKKAYGYALKDYQFWTHGPHLARDTGLSRFYDFGDGPVPELDTTAKLYYDDVVHYFLLHPDSALPTYLSRSKDRALAKIMLSDAFYKSDRAMRESGFDSSFRFGPFNADTIDYIPVDLNCLLFKAEKDMGWMCRQLGMKKKAIQWETKAEARRKKIDIYLWNAKEGLYFDYNFKTRQQSRYAYATTYYPLWVGMASPEQANKVANNLKLFEKPGGIVTSLRRTGVQWDYPYGWAPIQLVSVEGLYKYGFKDAAQRISQKFLSMVNENFLKDKTIREKYNVITRTTHTHIQFGYKTNVTGFGWTNGVFLVLLHEMPEEMRLKLLGVER